MSANNYLYIRKNGGSFEVWNIDEDGRGGYLIEKSDTFKGARKIARTFEEEEEVEYGTRIDENCYDD